MNPFVDHQILKDLPYEEMKKPTKEGINSFLKSKRNNQQLLALAYTIFGMIIFIGVLITVERGLAQYLIIFSSFSIIYRGILFFKSAKKFKMTDEEINIQIHKSIKAAQPDISG